MRGLLCQGFLQQSENISINESSTYSMLTMLYITSDFNISANIEPLLYSGGLSVVGPVVYRITGHNAITQKHQHLGFKPWISVAILNNISYIDA